jgi:hypothetical protein
MRSIFLTDLFIIKRLPVFSAKKSVGKEQRAVGRGQRPIRKVNKASYKMRSIFLTDLFTIKRLPVFSAKKS